MASFYMSYFAAAMQWGTMAAGNATCASLAAERFETFYQGVDYVGGRCGQRF